MTTDETKPGLEPLLPQRSANVAKKESNAISLSLLRILCLFAARTALSL